jgi:hypothetical protein
MNFSLRKKNDTLAFTPGHGGKREKAAAACAKWMNACGFILLFWGLLYPQPYAKVIVLLIAFPVLTLLVLARFGGLITLDVDRYHKDRPHLLLAFLAPICVIGFRAVYDWNILRWHGFWLPFMGVTIVFFLLTLVLAEDIRAKVSLIITALVFSAVFSFGTLLSLNCILDSSLAVVYQAKVLNKSVSHGKSTTYHLKISPWGINRKASDTHVQPDLYERKKIGDTVEIYTHQGRLGIPWFIVQ